MKLEDWLKKVKACPDRDIVVDTRDNTKDSLLHNEYGIYDNWPVLLRADYGEVLQHLVGSVTSRRFFARRYKPLHTVPSDCNPENRRQDFAYVRGIVIFQLRNRPDTYNAPDNAHARRWLRDYTMTFMLHPYQDDKPIPGVHRHRAMVWVIEDICNYAVKRNLPLCLPRSFGAKDTNDTSRIVYWP